MPPRFSKPAGASNPYSRNETPRGYRTPRGETPRHTPRGGSSNPYSRRDDDRPETRDRLIEDAYAASMDTVEINAKTFVEALIHVLRYRGGIQTARDHSEVGEDYAFHKASSHLTYIFRHTYLKHEDGSLSLNELFNHGMTMRKIKHCGHRDADPRLTQLDEGRIKPSMKNKRDSIRFLLPLAHVLANSNKSRFQIGYHTRATFNPSTEVPEGTWFSVAQFHQEVQRAEQASELEQLDIVSVFIRTESGHSTRTNIRHARWDSSRAPYRYLVHGTYESNLPSIRTHGLKPGGTRGGRSHVHFALDNQMTKVLDAVRRESDCLIILRSDGIDDLEPVFTAAGYVLTSHIVPSNRFIGIWSLANTGWLQKPEPSEMHRMTHADSQAEILMHVAHQQWYYDTRTQNELLGKNWAPHQYREYIAGLMANKGNLMKFVVLFNKEVERPRPPRDNSRNPERSRRAPPTDREDDESRRVKWQMSKRFKDAFRAAHNEELDDEDEAIKLKNTDSSSSESELPEMKKESATKSPGKPASKAASKPMPKQPKEKPAPASLWREKKPEVEPDTSEPAQASSSRAPAEKTPAAKVKKIELHSKTSEQAKEFYKDVEASTQVFQNMLQSFTNIQWFSKPHEVEACKNVDFCQNEQAMLFCHRCGVSYCLECRTTGQACDHHICNYSSELESFFFPDDIGSAESGIDIQELIQEAKEGKSQFGKSRQAQAEYRRQAFEILQDKAAKGSVDIKSTFMRQSLLRSSEENINIADYIYTPASRVPTLEEHFIENQVPHEPLPIYRPPIMLNCEYDDLTDDECYRLLEIYRSCMLSKKAITDRLVRTADDAVKSQRGTYTLYILSLNMGHINRTPVIAGHKKFPSYIRKSHECVTLPYIAFRNGAHIVCMCEASDDRGGIKSNEQVARDHGMIGMVLNAEISAPSLACFVRGSHEAGTFVELLLHHQFETENKQAGNQYWVFHGAVYRCVFGHNTAGEMIDPSSGIRTEAPADFEHNQETCIKPHPEPMASTLEYKDQCILEVDGNKETESCDHLKPSTGADVLDVRRLFLAEVRVAVFHIQSYAWSNSYQEACSRWLNFLSSAIMHSVDFITGDGNLFSQRNFKRDSHSDFKTCILVDLLERLLDGINSNRSPVNRITYNIVSSTQAIEYVRAQTDNTGDCDSMILISLCYGKQTMIVDDRAKNAQAVTSDSGKYTGPAFESEILLSDFEHPKHLTVYDFGLADSDQGWHSPLYVLCTIRCIKNFRIRKQEAEHRRRGRLEERTRRFEEMREDRREIRREQSDSVGPLPGEPAPETVYRYMSRERDDGLERGYSFSRTRGYSRERSTSREPAQSRRRQDRYDDDYDDYHDDGHYRQRPNVRYEQHRHRDQYRHRYDTSSESNYRRGTRRPREPSYPPDRSGHSRHRHRSSSRHRDQQPSTGGYWTNTRARTPGQSSTYNPRSHQQSYHQHQHSTGRRYSQPSYTQQHYQYPHVTYSSQGQAYYQHGQWHNQPRWLLQPDGSWFDSRPQYPWESIYHNLPAAARRHNELWLYGYTFSMGL